MACKGIDDVRVNIDRIDKEIVRLIAERNGFVKEATLYKKDHDGVRDTKRVEAVISKVRKLADEFGVSCELVERVYRVMINGFIELEMDEFNSKQKNINC